MKNIQTITQMNPELFAASISDINNFINRIKISDPKISNKENIAQQGKKKIKTEIEKKTKTHLSASRTDTFICVSNFQTYSLMKKLLE